jgi:hypothetical protein
MMNQELLAASMKWTCTLLAKAQRWAWFKVF